MAQQPQSSSQIVLGPAANGGGDIIHYTAANSNASAGSSFLGWVDKNGATQGVSFVVNGLQSSAAATISAAAGGVFSYTTGGAQVSVNLPGASAMEQVPFVVKASGFITLPNGTYTATIQPLLYASTTPGFTASAANAIFSAAAVGCTMTATTSTTVPWEVEAHLIGSSTSATASGWNQAIIPAVSTGTTITLAVTSPTIITNTPAFTASAAIPLQFAAGVTIAGTAGAGATLALGSFFLES